MVLDVVILSEGTIDMRSRRRMGYVLLHMTVGVVSPN